MEIKDLQKEAHAIAKEKGWHDKHRSVGDLIALCHSELSEALQEYRAVKPSGSLSDIYFIGNAPQGFAIELADLIIRVADMAELLGIDLEEAIKVKMAYNRTRPYRHGNKAI